MTEFARVTAPCMAMSAEFNSVEGDEPSFVGQHVHAPVRDDRRDVYRRADVELSLHLAARSVDADQLAGIGGQPACRPQNGPDQLLRPKVGSS